MGFRRGGDIARARLARIKEVLAAPCKARAATRDLARAIEVGLATASPYLIEIEL